TGGALDALQHNKIPAAARCRGGFTRAKLFENREKDRDHGRFHRRRERGQDPERHRPHQSGDVSTDRKGCQRADGARGATPADDVAASGDRTARAPGSRAAAPKPSRDCYAEGRGSAKGKLILSGALATGLVPSRPTP